MAAGAAVRTAHPRRFPACLPAMPCQFAEGAELGGAIDADGRFRTVPLRAVISTCGFDATGLAAYLQQCADWERRLDALAKPVRGS